MIITIIIFYVSLFLKLWCDFCLRCLKVCLIPLFIMAMTLFFCSSSSSSLSWVIALKATIFFFGVFVFCMILLKGHKISLKFIICEIVEISIFQYNAFWFSILSVSFWSTSLPVDRGVHKPHWFDFTLKKQLNQLCRFIKFINQIKPT